MKKYATSETALFITAVLVLFGFFLIKFSSLPPQVPLFYSLPNGEAQIVDIALLPIIPISLFIIIIFNKIYMMRTFPQNDFVKHVVKKANIIFILLMSYIFIKIISIIS